MNEYFLTTIVLPFVCSTSSPLKPSVAMASSSAPSLLEEHTTVTRTGTALCVCLHKCLYVSKYSLVALGGCILNYVLGIVISLNHLPRVIYLHTQFFIKCLKGQWMQPFEVCYPAAWGLLLRSRGAAGIRQDRHPDRLGCNDPASGSWHGMSPQNGFAHNIC